MAIALTQAELQQLAAEVAALLKAESQGVDNLHVADSLTNIVSLPALRQGVVVSVPVSLLKGADGREVQLRKTDTALQWRLGTSGTWSNLVALADIKGDKGAPFTFEDFTNEQLTALSAYGVWRAVGNEGTVEDYIASLKGNRGFSAYEVWLAAGNEGTEEDYFASLKGKPGEKGDIGRGFQFAGRYATPEDLYAAHPNGVEGNYEVGTEEPYDVYWYNFTTSRWMNSGAISGGGTTITFIRY